MKNKLKDLKNDKFRIVICILSLLLGLFYFWQYYTLDFNYTVILRFLLSIIIIPLTIFCGKKAIYFLLLAYSLRIAYINSYNNYTSFFCLLLSCRIMNRKYESALMFIYIINEVIALMIQNCEIYHITIHILTCAFWYVIYFHQKYCKNIILDLTDDEIKILEELAEGKFQKEIDFFNKNTISKKLKAAKKRNNCSSTNELLFKYRQSKEKL